MPKIKNHTQAYRVALIRRLTNALEQVLGEEHVTRYVELVDEAHAHLGHIGQRGGRAPSHTVTDAEFAAATHGDGRAAGYALRLEFIPQEDTRTLCRWSCPNCGHTNTHGWLGRAYYVCLVCGLSTHLRGDNVRLALSWPVDLPTVQ